MKLRVARSAVRDLDAIWAHVGVEKNIETAERLLASITRRFSFLARNPSARRSRSELREGLRSFPAGNYRIYYRQETRGGRPHSSRPARRPRGAEPSPGEPALSPEVFKPPRRGRTKSPASVCANRARKLWGGPLLVRTQPPWPACSRTGPGGPVRTRGSAPQPPIWGAKQRGGPHRGIRVRLGLR